MHMLLHSLALDTGIHHCADYKACEVSTSRCYLKEGEAYHHIACAAVPRAFAMLLMLRPSAAHVCVHKACQVVLSSPAHFAVASTR